METKVFREVVTVGLDGQFSTIFNLPVNEFGNGVILKNVYASVVNDGDPIIQKKIEYFWIRLYSEDFFTVDNSFPVLNITSNDTFNRNAFANLNVKVFNGITIDAFGLSTGSAGEQLEITFAINYEVLGKMAHRLR